MRLQAWEKSQIKWYRWSLAVICISRKKTFTCSLSDSDRLVISDSEAINKDTDRHAKTEKDTNTEPSYFSTVAV